MPLCLSASVRAAKPCEAPEASVRLPATARAARAALARAALARVGRVAVALWLCEVSHQFRTTGDRSRLRQEPLLSCFTPCRSAQFARCDSLVKRPCSGKDT